MSTAPCPDPDKNNEELFKAVDEIFEASTIVVDEDGTEWEIVWRDSDAINEEVAKFAAFLASTPTGVSPYDEG